MIWSLLDSAGLWYQKGVRKFSDRETLHDPSDHKVACGFDEVPPLRRTREENQEEKAARPSERRAGSEQRKTCGREGEWSKGVEGQARKKKGT